MSRKVPGFFHSIKEVSLQFWDLRLNFKHFILGQVLKRLLNNQIKLFLESGFIKSHQNCSHCKWCVQSTIPLPIVADIVNDVPQGSVLAPTTLLFKWMIWVQTQMTLYNFLLNVQPFTVGQNFPNKGSWSMQGKLRPWFSKEDYWMVGKKPLWEFANANSLISFSFGWISKMHLNKTR